MRLKSHLAYFVHWPKYLLLAFIEVWVQCLHVSEVLQTVHIELVSSILLKCGIVFNFDKLSQFLGHTADITVEYFTKFITHMARFELIKYFEQVQLRDFLVIICVEKVEGQLEHEIPIFDNHFDLLLKTSVVHASRIVQNIVYLLGKWKTESGSKKL